MTDSVRAPRKPDRSLLRNRFFADASRWSLGLVRGRPWTLSIGPFEVLRFGEPRPTPGGWTWPIAGGLLARAPGGALTVEWAGGELSARVEDYRPLLPAPLYRLLQVPVHHLTTRLFLLRLRGASPAPGRPPAPDQRALATLIDGAACLLLSRLRPRRALVVAAAYHIGFWALFGRTPGELAVGIRLVALDGSKVTAAQAAVRLVAGDSLAATAMVEAREA